MVSQINLTSLVIPNETIVDSNNKLFGITNKCVDWCREQHIIHNNNIEMEMLIMPGIALLSLILYEIFKNNKKFEKYIYKLINFAKVLLILFFIYFFWKYYF